MVALTERYRGIQMPEIKIIDTKNHAQLENARVELRTFTGATVDTQFTRAGGDFTFLRVGVGSYDIIAQQAGYHTVTLRVDVDQSILGLSIDLVPLLTVNDSSSLPPVSARELSIPRNAREAMDKGMALMERKSDYKGSIKQFERAIRDYPEYYEAYTQMGIAVANRGLPIRPRRNSVGRSWAAKV